MFSIRHSSDTGWIFPRKKKKTKQNNNTWPPTFTTALLRQFFFRGGFPKAARCQNHLKSHRRRGSECFFRETSHRPEQGWKCAQRFYRSCFFFCLCFSFSFFLHFWDLVFDSARPVTKYLSGCQVTPLWRSRTGRQFLQQPRLTTNEWINSWTNV